MHFIQATALLALVTIAQAVPAPQVLDGLKGGIDAILDDPSGGLTGTLGEVTGGDGRLLGGVGGQNAGSTDKGGLLGGVLGNFGSRDVAGGQVDVKLGGSVVW
jgi:hypothetical protein